MTLEQLERAAATVLAMSDRDVADIYIPIRLRDPDAGDPRVVLDVAALEYHRRIALEPDATPDDVRDYWRMLAGYESDPSTWPRAYVRPEHEHRPAIARIVRRMPQPPSLESLGLPPITQWWK